jgi:hypothetical protein
MYHEILHFLSIDYVRHRTWKLATRSEENGDSASDSQDSAKSTVPASAPPKRAFVVRLALNSMVWTAKSGSVAAPCGVASASRTFFINLPHNPLRPLNSSNDHAARARTVSRIEEVLCCLQVTSN